VTSYSAVGDTINYSFEVNNIGSVILTNLLVTDTFITGSVSCPTTTLASGETMTCTGSHTVTQGNIDQDIVFVNTAEVSGVPTEGTLGAVSGTLTIPGPEADNSMTITKQASKDTDVEVGDVITYTYEITNTGNITLNDVHLTDAHGGSGTLTPLSPANVSLAPNISQVFTTTYTVTQADIDAGGTIDNTATAKATPVRGAITEPTADETIAVIGPNPDAEFEKIASPDTGLDVGDTVTYTYTAKNTGNVTLNNVTITDVHNGSGTLSAITPANASVAPGASQSFTATYVITQADINAGIDIPNTATMTTTPAQGTLVDLEADETVALIAAPSISIDKVANNTGPFTVGDVVTYTYTVTNNGNVNINDLTISDTHNGSDPAPVPGNETLFTDNGTAGDSTDASVDGSWDVLAPGDVIVFTGTYTITQTDAANL